MPALLGSHLSRTLRAFQIYGANTNVGKTIFSTILAKASRRHFPAENVFYLKPVSTGAPEDADDGHVARFTDADAAVRAECLLQYRDPVSPHLVAVEVGNQCLFLAFFTLIIDRCIAALGRITPSDDPAAHSDLRLPHNDAINAPPGDRRRRTLAHAVRHLPGRPVPPAAAAGPAGGRPAAGRHLGVHFCVRVAAHAWLRRRGRAAVWRCVLPQ